MAFTDLVTIVQSRTGNHPLITTTLAGQLINQAHSEDVEKWEWSRKTTEVAVLAVADKTTGTLSTTNGTSTATGTGTSFGAADVGKFIRVSGSDDLYVINAVAGQVITFSDFAGNILNFGGSTSATAGYVLFQRFYSLGGLVHVEGILLPSRSNPIYEVAMSMIDATDSQRIQTGEPRLFARGPRSSTDVIQIELWPRPNNTNVYKFPCLRGHTDLSGSQTFIVPQEIIGWRAAKTACFFLEAKTKDPAWLKLADVYDREYKNAFQELKLIDQKKFGTVARIKDIYQYGDLDVQTDWDINKDTGF